MALTALALVTFISLINIFFILISLIKPKMPSDKILALRKLCLASIIVELITLALLTLVYSPIRHQQQCWNNDDHVAILIVGCMLAAVLSFNLEPPTPVTKSKELEWKVFYRRRNPEVLSEAIAIKSLWGTIRFASLNFIIFPIAYAYNLVCLFSKS